MEVECDKKKCDGDCPDSIGYLAEEVLSNGELIVYPTETLYGLGGDAFDVFVLDEIRNVKEAPADKKISTAYRSLEEASNYIDIPELAWELGEYFLPGPLTIVVKEENKTHGIRIPDHPVSKMIIEKFGPITATSANIHGMQDPVDMETAKTQLGSKVKLYINCGGCKYKEGTTVLLLHKDGDIEVLREGAISIEVIGDKLGQKI
ncbi:MAG: L-threonylcarbamoyladenylate synthase [Candidatus Saliniplasma sp.]